METTGGDDESKTRELCSKLVADPESTSVWSEYAEWLRERGDPRASFVGLNTVPISEVTGQSGHPLSPLVERSNQERWLGRVLPSQVSLEWLRAFPSKLTVASWPPLKVFDGLFSLPAFSFLRKIHIGPGHEPDFSAVGTLRLLATMQAALQFPKTFASLPRSRPESLQVLDLAVNWPLDEGLVGSLFAVPWLKELREIHLAVLSANNMELMLNDLEPLEALLHITTTEEGSCAFGERLRTRLPHAHVTTVPPPGLDNFTWRVGGAPRWAQRSFRELPPLKSIKHTLACQEGCCADYQYDGSGAPFANPVWRIYRGPTRCMSCGSPHTAVIFVAGGHRYYRRECETVSDEQVEYECKKCGKFTSFSLSWTS